MRRSWVCVDAGIVIHTVADPQEGRLKRLWASWHDAGWTVVAPRLLLYEAANGLYRLSRAGMLIGIELRDAFAAVAALPVEYRDSLSMHQRALELAAAYSLPAAYDAHYLALAESLGAELWTADQRLWRAVGHALPWVRVVG